MKKVSLIAIFATLSLASFSQISVSNVKKVGSINNGLSGIVDASIQMGDNSIVLKISGTTINKTWLTEIVAFSGGEKELDMLYEAFMNTFESGTSSDITLGDNNTIILNKVKLLGVSYLTISKGMITTRPINKSQINKLFGK